MRRLPPYVDHQHTVTFEGPARASPSYRRELADTTISMFGYPRARGPVELAVRLSHPDSVPLALLLNNICDAFEGILFLHRSQIRRATVHRRDTKNPYTVVRVRVFWPPATAAAETAAARTRQAAADAREDPVYEFHGIGPPPGTARKENP